MSRRKNIKNKSTTGVHHILGNAAYVTLIGVLLAVAIWSLRGHLSLLTTSSGENTTNPIGVVPASNPFETDLASLQAAERAQLNQPALVWFHADW